MSPLVTIGIPVFNAERWVRQSIESALAQDWPAIEVLVIDDGSSDRSPEIIRSFGAAIRAFFPPHRGGNPARNDLLRAARGEWVQFLDADDYLLPQKISTQLREADDLEACDLLVSPVWWEDYARGGERRMFFDPATRPPDPCRQVLSTQALQTNAGLWRKTALERIGGWDEQCTIAQDTELYCRAIRAGLRTRLAPTPNAVYRVGLNPASVSQENWARANSAKLELFLPMMKWMQARGAWTAEIHVECAYHAFRIVRQMAEIDLAAARRWEARLRAAELWRPADIARRRWAPRGYNLIYRSLGFGAAEWLSHKVSGRRAV